MEVKLHTREAFVPAVLSPGEDGVEGLEVLACLVDRDLRGVPIPLHLHAVSLVGVQLLEVVHVCKHSWPSLSSQVNWTLVFSSTLVIGYIDLRPVSTPSFIVPITRTTFSGGCLGRGQKR
jgi:hypothetical protein